MLHKDKNFHLPGCKELLANEDKPEVMLLDATESRIEYPQKKNG